MDLAVKAKALLIGALFLIVRFLFKTFDKKKIKCFSQGFYAF